MANDHDVDVSLFLTHGYTHPHTQTQRHAHTETHTLMKNYFGVCAENDRISDLGCLSNIWKRISSASKNIKYKSYKNVKTLC